MNGIQGLKTRLRDALDRERCIHLLRGAVAQESVTGHEANFVEWLGQRMSELRLEPKQADFAADRPNIWGQRIGAGNCPKLLFAGHTDTVHVRGWSERWVGTEREDPFSGAIVDGELWGRGAADLKGGICASLAALDLLDQAGFKLGGDVSFAFVGDEESGEPGTGKSEGARNLAAMIVAGGIPRPDFAIYVEPTGLNVFPAQMGFFIANVVITGRSAYFGVPERGIDALKAAHSALDAVWKHSDHIGRAGNHELVGPAFALVTEIQGGGYIAVPGECRFSLIRKIRPGECLETASAGLETAIHDSLSDHDVGVDINYPASRDHPLGGSPAEIDPSLTPVKLLCETMADASPGRGQIEGAPYWSESSIFINQAGCPTVYCAPGDIATCHTLEERINVEEYLAAVVAYAQFIAGYCGFVE
ncbi:MAG: M20/M25/M40 family metallo-hydrolase [Rhodobacteraceae bacterium]|nr:M20/M25/M40 family metallo-hydrolase [Paracoccaceae bacterium]